jgi:hypothetical protein
VTKAPHNRGVRSGAAAEFAGEAFEFSGDAGGAGSRLVALGESVGDGGADPFGDGEPVGGGGEPDGDRIPLRLAADDPVGVEALVGGIGVEVGRFFVRWGWPSAVLAHDVGQYARTGPIHYAAAAAKGDDELMFLLAGQAAGLARSLGAGELVEALARETQTVIGLA